MFKKYFADKKKRAKQLGPIVGVLLVAAIGTYLLVGSHAATPYSSIPATSGGLASGATSCPVLGATAGSSVVFNSPVAKDGNVLLDLSCPGTPFSPTSFWNTPVPSNVALNPNSADYVNEIANQVCYGYTTFSTAPTTCPSANNNTSALNTAEWSSPLYVVPADQPLVPVTDVCSTSTGFNNSVAGGVPVPADAHGSGGAYVPDTPTITPHGTAGTTGSYYDVASVTPSGSTTEPSFYGNTATGNATLSATNYNTVTWTPVAGATQYKIYRNYSSGTPSSEGLIGTVSPENSNSGPQTFNDTGLSGTTAPTGTDTDEEITIYQPSTDKEWEFWQFRKDSSNNWTACWGGGMSNVSTSDGVFPSDLGATATSLPLLGGIPRVAEFRAGQIDHVMNLSLGENFYRTAIVPATTPATYTFPANVTDPGDVAYSWPATRNDGGNSSTLAIPEGQRFILDPSLNLTQYNASLVANGDAALTPLAMTIAVAAQKYGFVVVDSAGSVSIRMPDPTTYTAAGLPNPYTSGPGIGGVGNQGLYEGKASNLIMKNFPWGHLEALPFNYGKPGS
jgi:hypothetical protein